MHVEFIPSPPGSEPGPPRGLGLYFKKAVFKKNNKNNVKLKYNKYNKTIIITK